MWIVCITSVRHVLTVNGYGGRQTKENEKSWCFKGWETLVHIYTSKAKSKELQNSHHHKDYYAIIFSFLYFLYFCKKYLS